MLDDLKYIHERDAQDALGIAEKQWQQLEYQFQLAALQPKTRIENVVYAGMGGSALAALLSATWPDYSLPFEIVRDYTLPSFVSDKTLLIVASYSGNTEEMLSVLAEAGQKNAQIVIITSGGKLAEIAKAKNYPLAQLPGGYQPRHAVLYNLKALVTILEKAGIVTTGQAEQTMQAASRHIKNAAAKWRPDIATRDNLAKQLALDIVGKAPVMYSGPLMFPAAYKWKISFNENAKNIAWCNQYPEFNHNEFLGWSSHPVDKPYTIINLRSNLEHPRVQKRFEVSERLLSGLWPSPITIEVQGTTVLEQLLWAVALGDFVSLYLAILNGLNPTPVDLIEKLKRTLDE